MTEPSDSPPPAGAPVERRTAEELFAEVESEVGLPAHLTGEETAAAVTCVLQQRLTGGEARHLNQALPRPVRQRLQGCLRHQLERPETFDRAGFLARLALHLGVAEPVAEDLARAVCAVLGRWLPVTVVEHVASQLPADLRDLWTVAERPIGENPPEPIASAVFEEVRRNAALADDADERAAVVGVLCTLCQRLSRGEARDVIRELPPAIGSLVERCALHRDEPGEVFDREEFVHRVALHLGVPVPQAEQIARVVFTAVERFISPREVRDVASQLPHDLQSLWTGAAAAAGVPAP
jgi:uncharacterized protein (DUF2267 family)